MLKNFPHISSGEELNSGVGKHSWLWEFPSSEVAFSPLSMFDNSSMVVSFRCPSARGSFKIFEFWAEHSAFIPFVNSVWIREVDGYHLFRLCRNLRILKHPQNFWFREIRNASFYGLWGMGKPSGHLVAIISWPFYPFSHSIGGGPC